MSGLVNPRRFFLAGRLACLFSEEPWLPEFVRHIFLANFAYDRDIPNADVVKSMLDTIGQPANLIDAARSPDAKAKFRTATERAVSLGIFGAPSFVLCSELFWSNDRLESAINWASRSHPSS
jgi:2-hydroxychromene-2-carboxylate isomerase